MSEALGYVLICISCLGAVREASGSCAGVVKEALG